ncbi:MAG TPA: rod shape-determining protein MreC [Fluviicoccus sp.]|jgi:rod shape-determining protein MreC|nr:rod shape-determining protein MreC [Fluviicoccus sp.]
MTALAAAGALMLAEGRFPEDFKVIRSHGVRLLEPLHQSVLLPGRLESWLVDIGHTRASLRRENATLRAEQLQYAVRLQKLAELSAENARLRGLLSSDLVTDGRMLLAEVVRSDPDPDQMVLMLDKGLADGVTAGQPVLDANGIMGQVIEVVGEQSRVMLISDRRHGIAVQDERSGARGILQGTGDNARLELQYAPESADIVKGDLLVSSGLGVRFPAGYPVAVVKEVFRSGGGEFARVQAVPVATLSNSRHVVLLFPPVVKTPKPVVESDAERLSESPDASP